MLPFSGGNKWLILFLAFMVSFSYFFAFQSIPPVIPQIMGELDLAYGEAGLLMSTVAVTGAALSLLGWPMIARWGIKKTTATCLVVCVAGTIIVFSGGSYAQLILGRAVLGVGGGLVTVSSFAIVALWFQGRDTGRAMGFKAIDMPAAAVVALNALPLVAVTYGWRGSILISTVLLIVTAALLLGLFSDRPVGEARSSPFAGVLNRHVWILGMVWAFFNMAVISYLTWAGTFYIQLKDLTPSLAFFLASAVMLVSIPVSPVAGRLISRYGTKRFLVAPTLGIAVSLAAVPFLSPPWLFVAVVALAASVPFLPPAVFTIPSVLLSPERAGLAFAVLFTCANLGFLAGPLAVGMVQDAYPSGVPSFLTMAAFAAAALVLGFTLKTK